jgi:YfiH family protein
MTLGFAPDWRTPPNVRAWVTERAGGTSRGLYSTLNLAGHVGDEVAAVAANRARLRATLGLPSEPEWLTQVHGRRVLDLDAGDARGEADGAVTGRPGVVCAVLTADCLPVLICSADGGRIGVAHAGWRGLAAGVLPAAVAAVGGDPGGVSAWLGPAISAAAYEVGDEVRAAFTTTDPAAAACFRRNPGGRWQADLYALARLSLAAAGVSQIGGGGFCTFGNPSRFFSHRREAPCGRMATLIWRER